jgi:hypothetical protein
VLRHCRKQHESPRSLPYVFVDRYFAIIVFPMLDYSIGLQNL